MVDLNKVPPNSAPSSPGTPRPATPSVKPPSSVPVARPLVAPPILAHGPLRPAAPVRPTQERLERRTTGRGHTCYVLL